MKYLLKKCFIFIIIGLFIGVNLAFAVGSQEIGAISAPGVVYVDDDFDPSTSGWGYDHFDNIQDGVDGVSDSGFVYIYQGGYTVFQVVGRSNIVIKSIEATKPNIGGNQLVWDFSLAPPSQIRCVVFVDNSDNILLEDLNVQGSGLSGRSYAVFYNGSSGEIKDCVVAPNQRGNMNSLAVRAQWNSDLSIENCTIRDYGRIGIYCRTGTILNAIENTIIGQIYTNSDGDFVSYGIEVEDLVEASIATIRLNEIYNHDHTGTPTWSSAAIIVDSWRYYEVTPDECSALIEYNYIHDNMLGLQIVPNENIHVNYNRINDNTEFGAVSDPYWDGAGYVHVDLDAENNYWGDPSGPYHPSENPSGLGNEVTDYVIFTPWKADYLPSVKITNPIGGFLYYNFRDIIVFKFPFIMTLILGKNDVEVEVTPGIFDIARVEFYIDEDYKSSDPSPPYQWTWDERTPFFPYTIKAFVYDTNGFKTSDSMRVWKSQLSAPTDK